MSPMHRTDTSTSRGTMKAALFRGAGQPLDITQVERAGPLRGEALVRVHAAGVCGAELHFLEGLLTPARTPIILGHEVAGTVVETGEDVEGGRPRRPGCRPLPALLRTLRLVPLR